MPTTKELLTGFLAKTLNWPEDKVASLFSKDDGTEVTAEALQLLTDADAARVQTFKTENQTYFDNGHKKGKGEALKAFETELKAKHGIASDKLGLELVDEIVVAAKGKETGLEEDKVKVHPVYVNKVNELDKKIKDTETAWQTKYDEREQGINKEKTFRSINAKAEEILTALKPVLPKDAAKQAAQKAFLLKQLEEFEYELPDGKTEYTIKKDGKLYEDAHGSPVKFDQLVKTLASGLWDFESGEQRSNTGAKTGKDKSGNEIKVTVPKNEQEYTKAIAEAKSPEERIAISDAWTEASKATA